MTKSLYLLVFLFLQTILPVCGQGIIRHLPSDNIHLDPEVRHGVLDNGFTYYIRRNNRPSDEIELHLVVKAGFNHEDQDQKGYAHLLEHVGANSTKHFPKFHNYFHSQGRYSNATTSNNYTNYFVRIPSGDQEVLKAGLQSVRDRAQDILMKRFVIDRERKAILGEMRTINPYNNWLTGTIRKFIEKNIGISSYNRDKLKNGIENFNQAALMRYYKDWYRPSLQAAIIVGDINLDSTESRIIKMFSDLKNPILPLDAQASVDAQVIDLKDEIRFYKVKDTVMNNFRVHILSKRANYKYRPRDRKDYKKMLLQQIYNEIMIPRGKFIVGQQNPPISSFSPEYRENQFGGGQLWVSEVLIAFNTYNPKDIREKFIDALITRKRMHLSFTEKELFNAKNKVFSSFLENKNSSNSSLSSRYRKHFVKGQAAPNPIVEMELVAQLIKSIDLKMIQEFAANIIDLSKNTDFLFFVGDVDVDVVPNYKIIEKWVSEVKDMELKPFKMDIQHITSDTLLKMAYNPVGEKNIIKQSSENLVGVTTFSLQNNIKVVLKPTKPISTQFNDRVSIYGYRNHNIPYENREDYLIATIAGKVIKYAGLESLNSLQLNQFMNTRGIQLNFNLTKTEKIINGQCKSAYFEDFVNLLYLYTVKPRKSINSFKDWKANYKMQLKFGKRSSTAFYEDIIESIRFPMIPQMTSKDLNALTLEKVYEIYNQLYGNYTGYTFIITGDFDINQLTSILEKYIASFPQIKIKKPLAENSPVFPLKKMSRTIYLDNLDQALVRLYFPVRAPTDIKTKITLRLLSKALNERIFNRLRNGCYFPSASGSFINSNPGLYEFEIAFDSELTNLENMIRFAKEEFELLRKDGVDQKWLEKAKITEIKSYGNQIDYFGYSNNNIWPGYLKDKLKNNKNPTMEVLQYKTILEHFININDINIAARKYLNEEFYQSFICLPKEHKQNDFI